MDGKNMDAQNGWKGKKTFCGSGKNKFFGSGKNVISNFFALLKSKSICLICLIYAMDQITNFSGSGLSFFLVPG